MNTTTLVDNQIKICHDFLRRRHEEFYEEWDGDYVYNHEMSNLPRWSVGYVYIADMFLDFDYIWIAEHYQIPCKMVMDWYWLRLEKSDGEVIPNLYNYYNVHK